MKCNVDNNKHDYFVRTNSNKYPNTEFSQIHTLFSNGTWCHFEPHYLSYLA